MRPDYPVAIFNACVRARAAESLRLRRGVASLATIAAAAPLVGFLGTAIGIIGAFRGSVGEKSTIMAGIVNCLSEALVFTAAALGIAIVAYWSYFYLRGRQEGLEREMETMSLALANALRR